MAFAFVQDFPPDADDTSTSNYDAIHASIMQKAGDQADVGLIIHTAGHTEDGFRIFEVWESREQCEKFMNEVVMPSVMEVTKGSPGTPPRTTGYELHNLLRP
jgi:quinol monooxygenase YgiN